MTCIQNREKQMELLQKIQTKSAKKLRPLPELNCSHNRSKMRTTIVMLMMLNMREIKKDQLREKFHQNGIERISQLI